MFFQCSHCGFISGTFCFHTIKLCICANHHLDSEISANFNSQKKHFHILKLTYKILFLFQNYWDKLSPTNWQTWLTDFAKVTGPFIFYTTNAAYLWHWDFNKFGHFNVNCVIKNAIPFESQILLIGQFTAVQPFLHLVSLLLPIFI